MLATIIAPKAGKDVCCEFGITSFKQDWIRIATLTNTDSRFTTMFITTRQIARKHKAFPPKFHPVPTTSTTFHTAVIQEWSSALFKGVLARGWCRAMFVLSLS